MKWAGTAVVITLLVASLALPSAAGFRTGKYLGGLHGLKEVSVSVETGPFGDLPGLRTSDVLNIVEQPLTNIGLKLSQEVRFAPSKTSVPRLKIELNTNRLTPDDYSCKFDVTLTDEATIERDPSHRLWLAIWQREFSDTVKAHDAWLAKAELTAIMAAFVIDYLADNQARTEGSSSSSRVYEFRHSWGDDCGSSFTCNGPRELTGPLAVGDQTSSSVRSTTGSVSHSAHAFGASGSFGASSSSSGTLTVISGPE
jgi:hypothetical protein